MHIIGEGDVNYFFFFGWYFNILSMFLRAGGQIFFIKFFEDVFVAHVFLPKKIFFFVINSF